MKFVAASSELAARLQAVSKVINSKNALSIFDNFLLRVEGNRLFIKGSDQENVMETSMELSETDGDGAVAMNARMLLDTLKEVPNLGLTFYVNDQTKEVELRFLNSKYNFVGIDAELFPQSEQQEESRAEIILPSSTVLKGIESTLFSVSTDTTRPSMTGIFWDIHPADVTFVSTDTHKLVKYVNSTTHTGLETSFIMPAKPGGILRSIISKDSSDISVSVDSRSIRFAWDDFSLECRKINGNYPNYERVIPKDNPFKLTIDRNSLMATMRRLSIVASMASGLVRFNIQPNEIIVSGDDYDSGKAGEERLTCDYAGNSMVIGFNARYMLEVLSNLKSDTVVIELCDPARPGVLVPAQQEETETILMLLMPMHLS